MLSVDIIALLEWLSGLIVKNVNDGGRRACRTEGSHVGYMTVKYPNAILLACLLE